jgi:hypothetical protein
VAVLLVALAIVMALGIIGVLKTVCTSSDNTDNRNNRDDKGRTTLSALVKTREIGVVVLNPQGPSHGDMASSTPALQRKRNKEDRAPRPVPRHDRPAEESAEKANLA